MKKIRISLVLSLVGLIFVGQAWATKCVTHIVKAGETIESITEDFTGNSDNCSRVVVGKNSQGQFIFLKPGTQLETGRMVYIVKARIINKTSLLKKPLVQKTKLKESLGNLKLLDEPNVKKVLRKSLIQKTEPEKPSKILTTSSDNLSVRTDLGKALKDWNGTAGYSTYGDLDAGKEKVKRSGYNYNGSLTIYPWKVSDWKFGPQVRYNFGKGKRETSDRKSTYKYNRLEVGIKAEIEKDNKTTGFGLGISKQKTRRVGTDQGQRTWSAHLRGSYEDEKRRAEGEKLFPTHNFSGEYRHQLNAKTSGGASEYDESTLKVGGKFGIYDYEVGDSGFRITPEVNLQTGFVWGKDSAFIGGGPGLTVGDEKNDFAEIRFLNPRLYLNKGAKGASRLERFAITLKPDDIYRALKAAQVKDYPGEKTINE